MIIGDKLIILMRFLISDDCFREILLLVPDLIVENIVI